MRDKNRLTDLEMVVMRVLWENEKPMTIQEITTCLENDEKLSVQSVTQVMSRLVKRHAVEVSGLVLISNVYARSFTPVLTQQEVLETEIKHLQKGIFSGNKISTMSIVAALMNNDEGQVTAEDMDELQNIIAQKKKQISKKK